MSWKKILIATGLFIVVLIAAFYVFLAFYDFNKLKPMIAKTVKDATGRELAIAGNIDFDMGIRPTLVVEDVSFQNAAWGSKPNLARVKRLEVQIAIWPLISGNFDFVHVVLIEPDVIMEFDSAGTSNFSFDPSSEEEKDAAIPPPPLIFSDVSIEKGLFTYEDAQSDIKFFVRIDRLKVDIPGFDKSLQLDFEGAFNDIPFTLDGTLGPIWAWVEPGYTLPANLTLKAGGATAKIDGEIRAPASFKDLAFTIAAEGASTVAIAKLVGVTDIPELGAFKLAATVADTEGPFAIEGLDIKVGSEDLVAISITGNVKNVPALQGIKLDFSARGRDVANLTQLGMPPLPKRGAFEVSADISDSTAKVFSVSDLNIILGKNEISGQINLDLAEQIPTLTAMLISPKFEFGSLNLDLKMTGPLEKPAIEKLDLKLGTPELAEIRLNGVVNDLMELQGVDINFQASGKDLANLKQVIRQPLPVRGAFSAAGKVLIPVPKNLQVPDLKITVGTNNIRVSLNLNLMGDKPQLEAKLSLPKLDLSSVLLPELAKQGWARGLGQVRPVKLAVKLVGFAQEITLKEVDLWAGTSDSVELRLIGSVANIVERRGIDLNFNIRGMEVANLAKISGKTIPLKGTYGLSGRLTDPTQKNYKVSDLKLKLGENNITGSLDLNLDGKQLRLAADLAAPQVTLQPVTLTALEELSRIEDLGPLKLAIKLAGAGNKLALDNLDFNLGREDLIEVLLKGTISDLSAVRGMKLEFTARGNNMSLFKKLGGPEMPFEGAFYVSAQFIDPAPKVYKIPVFNAVWGDNKGNGWLELDLSAKRPRLKGELSSDKLDLRPLFAQDKKKSIVKAQSIESAPKKDQKPKSKTDPSKSGIQKAKVFPSESLPLGGLQVIDADLKFRDKQLLLPALVLDDVIVDVLLKDDNLEIKPFKFTIDGGKADIQFALRSQEKPAALAATLNIDQLEIGPLIDELGYQRSVEGNMDAALNLDSSGDSVAALMAGLNGNIRITMSDGRAASEYLDLLEKYLGSGILRILNPFQEKRKYASINCFVNTIEIKDGLADVKLLLDTDRTSIFGAGDINLKTERLDLGIKPTPKKGAGPADFSLSLKVLSQPFRLGGTLANPSLVIDPGRAAFVVGRLAGALALGPFGIASFFGDISVGKKDPCKVALQAAKQEEQTLEGKKADESTKKADTKNKNEEKKKSKGFFRRLFGK